MEVSKVIRDNETGVLYMFHRSGPSAGLTVMVDQEGKPLVDKDFKATVVWSAMYTYLLKTKHKGNRDLLGSFIVVKAAYVIEISAIIIIIFLLIIFVPKNKIREASVILMFKQLITWVLGLSVVQFNWIAYPDRLFFSDATRASFTFEYFLYPAICVFFVLYYPKHYGWVGRFMYYLVYCSAITTVEVLIEHYTTAIKYSEEWHWYSTWLSLFGTFYISRRFYLWFFKKKVKGDAYG